MAEVIARGLLVAVLLLLPQRAIAQSSEPADSSDRPGDDPTERAVGPPVDLYVPIRGAQRVEWIVDGTVGAPSLAVGVLSASWQTGFNVPREWGRTWRGFGKRFLEREADVAISNTLEAGLGAIWGEEPRYIPSGRQGVWPRVRYALKTVFLAERPNGDLAPAWGRHAGNLVTNVVENRWLPPSVTTWKQTTVRSATGVLGRAAGNLWDEFWPDLRRRVK